MTLYGYARVSVREPEDKNLDLQVERLVRAGCSLGNIRAEEASGARNDRGGLLELLDLAERTGDGFLPMAFGTAESCHANFYNDWMDQEHLETYLPGIQRLVRQLLDVRASDAGGNHE